MSATSNVKPRFVAGTVSPIGTDRHPMPQPEPLLPPDVKGISASIEIADYTPEGVARAGRDHAARVLPGPGELVEGDPRMLWSLTMATTVRTWHAAAGFDERYVGYGGEDTDFGQRLAASGGSLWWLGGAAAYHQYHPTQSPPVQHAAAIARNANLFRRTWGFDPMEGWLRELRNLGVLTRAGEDWHVFEQGSTDDA